MERLEKFKKAVIDRAKNNTDEHFGSYNDLQIVFYEVFGDTGDFYDIMCDSEKIYVLRRSLLMYNSEERRFREKLSFPLAGIIKHPEFLKRVVASIQINESGSEVYLFSNTIIFFEKMSVWKKGKSNKGTVTTKGRDQGPKKVRIGIFQEPETDCDVAVAVSIVTKDIIEVEILSKYFEPGITDTEDIDRVSVATIGSFGMKNRAIEIQSVKELDIDKNYNSNLPIDTIEQFILNRNEGGLILFYGKPGTGKTTLIRHLLSLRWDNGEPVNFVLFSESFFRMTNTDEFLNYYLNQPEGTVFILEDCEKILQSRESNPGNMNISALLDMTDGILGNAINTKFLCTFNTDINRIDEALLRKGRLKLKYEFKPLSLEKTRLHIPDATTEMTLAEIYNNDDKVDFTEKKKSIGFTQ